MKPLALIDGVFLMKVSTAPWAGLHLPANFAVEQLKLDFLRRYPSAKMPVRIGGDNASLLEPIGHINAASSDGLDTLVITDLWFSQTSSHQVAIYADLHIANTEQGRVSAQYFRDSQYTPVFEVPSGPVGVITTLDAIELTSFWRNKPSVTQ